MNDEWDLTNDQMFFLLQLHNEIYSALENNDIEFFERLAQLEEYITLFGNMSLDEALDRYECMIDGGE